MVGLAPTQIGAAQNPQNVTAPMVLAATVPSYPDVALSAGITGVVEVTVTVRKGIVTKTETESSAHRGLVKAATQNIRTWKFATNANAVFKTTYTYEIDNEQVAAAENPRIELALPYSIKIIGKRVKPTCSDCGAVQPTVVP